MTPPSNTPGTTPAPHRSRPVRPPAPQARRGPVGARLPRAAQPQRAVQEGRRRAQRPGPHREHLRARAASPRSTRADLRGRFRWWGLYTQRKPGHRRRQDRASWSRRSSTTSTSCCGSASTAASSTTEQLRAIAEISTRVRPGHRRHHRPAEHPAALDPHRGRARRSGSGSRRSACPPPRPAATRPRVVLGSPGRRHRRRRDHRRHAGASTEIKRRYIGDPEFSNLPRKFKTAISGYPLPGRRPRDQRHLVRRRRRTPSTAPASTSGSAAGCPPTRCSPSGSAPGCRWTRSPTCGPASSAIFRDYGYRRLRNRARLKFLVADWGVEKFREVLEKEYLDRALVDGPAPARARRSRSTTSACTGRRTAASTSASRRPSAGSPARMLTRLADLAEAHGSDRVRTHAVPEAARPRRRRGPGRRRWSTALRRRSGSAARPVALAARHDGLHRHRVLQARDRRDQGARRRR